MDASLNKTAQFKMDLQLIGSGTTFERIKTPQMFLKVYKGGIVSLQGASFSRKSKKWSGNKLGLLVLMMDEGSVMERAYFTVVPLLF